MNATFAAKSGDTVGISSPDPARTFKDPGYIHLSITINLTTGPGERLPNYIVRLTQSEARAIASALMGAAAEIKS